MSDLVPVEQKTITFYNDELTAVRVSDGQIYVSIKHMCDALGIAQRGQVLRIKRNDVLSEGYEGEIMMITPGGRQRAGMLRADLVPLWLSGIETSRVNEEVRDKLVRYQKEVAKVLWEAFQDGRLTADHDFDELLAHASQDAVDAYQMAMAIVKLARNQIVIEAQLTDHGRVLADYGRRLETIEADMHHEERTITETQATEISQAVKSIAIAMGKKTGRNEFGATWGEFYRKFGVSKYRHLPAAKFEEAMAWLNEFYQSLVGDAPF